MAREKIWYRDTVERVNTLFPNRLTLKTAELAEATGLSENSVRDIFSEAKVKRGIYNIAGVIVILCS